MKRIVLSGIAILLFMTLLQGTTPLAHAVTIQHTLRLPHQNLEIDAASDSMPTPAPAPDAIGPRQFPKDVNPLTGQTVEEPETLQRRPIIAKISNAPALVRPQAGINQADIVFEHYVEGGLTRFSALFYGQAPDRVGSIRSARLIDHEIVPMFDGMLAFSGASLGVEKYIYGSDYVNTFYDDIEGIEDVYPGAPQPPSEYAERAYKGVMYSRPYFWRDESVIVPHNMFTNPNALWELAATEGHAQRPRLQGLAFHPAPPHQPTGSASQVDVRYRGTRAIWNYNPDIGQYERVTDGEPHRDANTGEQVTSDNVVILYAEHTETPVVEARWQGNPIWSIQIAVWGRNDAVLFRDGQRYDGYWTRTKREDIISLRTQEGELLYLKPGQTWFQVVRAKDQQDPDAEWLRVDE